MFLFKSPFVLFVGILLHIVTGLSADKIRCSTAEVFKRNALNHPDAILRKQQLESDIQHWIAQNAVNRENGIQTLITIPVVVHVVYGKDVQNISDAQIQSQIERLNKDFSNSNADKLHSSHPFFTISGNSNIEFCLTRINPNGNSTNGITRTATTVSEFSDNNDVKFAASGGEDAWDARQYLNIWVCNLGGDLLGYAQFPSDLASAPETDGVVIGYNYFGRTGTVSAPFNKGRTCTHEVGHWVGLYHIWGDDNGCGGTDNIADTPNQDAETYNCPSGVQTDACSPTAPGYMWMNYMDYTDDACMYMFTEGQKTRMRAIMNTSRAALANSMGCVPIQLFAKTY